MLMPLVKVTFQVPAILASKLVPPRIWIGGTVIGWGLSSTLMVRLPEISYKHSPHVSISATTFNFPGLIVARFALGIFEAAFSPGFPLYLCM